jgi:succinate-semialdehyde dehydrogenase/glutarate-semialdehyde dehydrogenase
MPVKRTARPRAKKAEEIVSFNPATLDEVGRVRVTHPSELEAIVRTASDAQRRWAQVPLRERARLIQRAANHILDNHEKVAELITRENGKTITEAYLMEVLPVLDTFHYVAKHGPQILARERIPTPQLVMKHKRHYFDYTPYGVIGIISPWNYPFSIPGGETAIALFAGNAVILKPSPLTPLIGEQIAHVFSAVGLPDGLLTVVHGDAPIGAAMCEHEGIGTIFFTGSVETGRKVGEAAGRALKPVVLELGGKDAAIVCSDADLDRAVRGIMWGGCANSGQSCAGVERVYVARPLYDEFVDRASRLAEQLKPGDPLDPATQVGPFTDPGQYEKVVAQVDDAVEHGAKRVTGGPVDTGMPGKWYAPAIVTDVDQSMTLMREETFGPVVPVMAFDDEQDALKLANDSEYGLGASVWSKDTDRASKLAGELDAGSVWVNDHMYSHGLAQLPWGGAKRSGVGVTHSKFGFYACVRPKLLSVDSGRIPVAFWHPYDERLRNGIDAILHALYSPSAGERLRTVLGSRSEFKGIIDKARHPNGSPV